MPESGRIRTTILGCQRPTHGGSHALRSSPGPLALPRTRPTGWLEGRQPAARSLGAVRIIGAGPAAFAVSATSIRRGLRHIEQTLGTRVTLTEARPRMIAGRSSGDARRALTTLESLCVGRENGSVTITQEMVDEAK